jgi:hypothetical protein
VITAVDTGSLSPIIKAEKDEGGSWRANVARKSEKDETQDMQLVNKVNDKSTWAAM